MTSSKMIRDSSALAALMLALLMIMGAHTSAAVLVDSGQNGSSVGNLEPGGKAIGFTMGATPFFLDSVEVRLRTGSAAPINSDMTFAIYTSTTSGNIKPDALGVELTDPSLALNTTQSYTLTPLSTFTLEANTTYWMVAFSSTTVSDFGWTFDNPDSVATTNGVTVPSGGSIPFPAGWFFNQFAGGNDVNDPNTWTGNSGITNDVVIQGSVIPEPASMMLLAAGGIAILSRRRIR